MGRKLGTPKTGGRVKGTPNKIPEERKELKAAIANCTIEFWTDKCIEEKDKNGNLTGRLITRWEDCQQHMKPSDVASAYLTLLKYCVPQLQATSVDMNVAEGNMTIAERITMLARGEEVSSSEDE